VVDEKRRLVEGVLDGDSVAVSAAAETLGDELTHRVLLGAFILAVQKQFAGDVAPADVSSYVSDLRRRLVNGEQLKPMPTEAMIRAVLEDPELRAGVSQEDAAAAYLGVTFAVTQDHNIRGVERDEFVREVLDTVS
jgi:hypothetical protein